MSAIFKKKTFLIQLNVCSKSSSWKTTSKNWKQNVITIKLENLTLNVCKSNLKFNDNGILSAPLQTRQKKVTTVYAKQKLISLN